MVGIARDAVSRWEELIVGDLPDFQYNSFIVDSNFASLVGVCNYVPVFPDFVVDDIDVCVDARSALSSSLISIRMSPNPHAYPSARLSYLNFSSLKCTMFSSRSLLRTVRLGRARSHTRYVGNAVRRFISPYSVFAVPRLKGRVELTNAAARSIVASFSSNKKVSRIPLIERITSDPRAKQGLLNWIFSFAVVLFAAQSLKSAKYKEKVEKQLEQSQAISEERAKALRSL